MKKADVLKHFGSQQKTADAVGVHQTAVSKWGEYVPELHARRLADLFPEVFTFDADLYRHLAAEKRRRYMEFYARRERKPRADHATAAKRKERSRHE